jgi:hypothetical protein
MNATIPGRIPSPTSLERRFEERLAPEGRRRRELSRRIEDLKVRLLRQQVMAAPNLELIPAIHRAANEAAAEAWFTPCPLLVFPTLLEEKVASAKQIAERQERIREQTRKLLARAM